MREGGQRVRLGALIVAAMLAGRLTEAGSPRSYVVRWADGYASAAHGVSRDEASALARVYGGDCHRVYSHALHGAAVRMTAEAAAALASDPRVASIEEDVLLYASSFTQTDAPYELDRIDSRGVATLSGAYNYALSGDGVHAYVLDTGIRSTHVEFTGRIGTGTDFVGDGFGTEDCYGHGTHVAGILGGTRFGVAKHVTLHSVRVLDCDGTGPLSDVIAGIDWVTGDWTENHAGEPAVVNMSLGGSYSLTLNQAVAGSIAAGLTYVIAAGNALPGHAPVDACTQSPASVPSALTVGSTTIGLAPSGIGADGQVVDYRSSFSDFGACVDLYAPGSGVTSAYNTSDTATAVFSGTSMATPLVAGVVANYLSYFGVTAPSVVATDVLGVATEQVVLGSGVVNNRLLYQPCEWTAPFAACPELTTTSTTSTTSSSASTTSTSSSSSSVTTSSSTSTTLAPSLPSPRRCKQLCKRSRKACASTCTGTRRERRACRRACGVRGKQCGAPTACALPPE
jgi:subtilisin family serine protease